MLVAGRVAIALRAAPGGLGGSLREVPCMARAADRAPIAMQACEATSATGARARLDRALLAARACSLAFVPPTSIPNEPYSSDLRLVAQVEDPASQAGASMFEADDGEVVIACRGSSSVRSFRTNLDVGPVPLVSPDGEHPDARVHAGFQRAASALWAQLEPAVPAGTRKVLVTGHSLGGGTATLIALRLLDAGRPAELLAVAGPRLGNGAFAEYFRRKCEANSAAGAMHLVRDDKTIRTSCSEHRNAVTADAGAAWQVHDEDGVLSSNTELWDRLRFVHVGEVVRCSKDEPLIYDDPSPPQPKASASGPPSLRGVFVDHCRYLGVYIGVRLEHPGVWLRRPW